MLMRHIGDENEWVRTRVAESLVMLGTPYTPHLNDLVTSLEDGTDDINAGRANRGIAATRRRAVQALGQRGGTAAPHVKAVADLLDDKDIGVQRRAAEALARISVDGEGAAVRPHGGSLARCLRADNTYLRTSAAEAVMCMGSDASRQAPALSLALLDNDADVRRKAAEALGRIGLPAAKHLKALSMLLRDSDPGCRRCACEAMLNMGEAAGPYAQDLAQLLADPASGMRYYVAEGLQRLGAQGAEALAFRLGDKDPVVREMASTMLQEMGPTGQASLTSALAKIDRVQRLDVQNRGSMTSRPRETVPAHVRMRLRGPGDLLGQHTSPRLHGITAR
jgi:hypothetical protein